MNNLQTSFEDVVELPCRVIAFVYDTQFANKETPSSYLQL